MHESFKRAAAGFVRAGVTIIFDLPGLAGVASITYGAWLIYEPAGFLVGGVMGVAWSALAALARRKAG